LDWTLEGKGAAGGSKPTRTELQHIRSVLLRGKDVYQPEDLAAKLAASAADVSVVIVVTAWKAFAPFAVSQPGSDALHIQ
jgi:hypothetical protein